MSDFSPTDAALEGFRISRERPLAILIWAVAYFLSSVVQQAALIGGGFGPLTEQLRRSFGNLTPQAEQQISPLIQKNFPVLLGFVVIGLFFTIIMSTAVLRAVLRPAESRFGYLRLSRDELRQFGLFLMIAGIGLLYLFVIALVSAIVGGLAQSLGGGPVSMLLNLLLSAATLCALIYPAIRLSLAPAMTFADGRISLFRSWALTNGRFWPLLGTYVMALLLAAVVFLLTFVIFTLVANFAGHGAPDVTSLRNYFTPLTWVALVFSGLITALLGAITTAPVAAAFRQIAGRVGAPRADTANGSPWETT